MLAVSMDYLLISHTFCFNSHAPICKCASWVPAGVVSQEPTLEGIIGWKDVGIVLVQPVEQLSSTASAVCHGSLD